MNRSGKNEIGEKLRETAEDLVELVTAQIKLTRLELVGDVRTLGARLGRLAIFAVLLIVGYTFASAAGAWLLAQWIGLPGALAIVAGINVTVGGIGVWKVAQSVQTTKVLDRANEELARSVHVLAAGAQTDTSAGALPAANDARPQSAG